MQWSTAPWFAHRAMSAQPHRLHVQRQISNLFQPLPVRHQEFKRNIKKEFSRLHDVLAGYSLVARDVRLAVSNTAKKAGRQNVLRTPGNGSLKDCISSVFGIRQLKNLEQMDARSGAHTA